MLIEVGVILPSESVIAGVVVDVATDPETPLAATTDTLVTVPVAPVRAYLVSPFGKKLSTVCNMVVSAETVLFAANEPPPDKPMPAVIVLVCGVYVEAKIASDMLFATLRIIVLSAFGAPSERVKLKAEPFTAVKPIEAVGFAPTGLPAPTAAVTKAVVANCVVLVPGEAVGAAGMPVNVGEAIFAFKAKAIASCALVLKAAKAHVLEAIRPAVSTFIVPVVAIGVCDKKPTPGVMEVTVPVPVPK